MIGGVLAAAALGAVLAGIVLGVLCIYSLGTYCAERARERRNPTPAKYTPGADR